MLVQRRRRWANIETALSSSAAETLLKLRFGKWFLPAVVFLQDDCLLRSFHVGKSAGDNYKLEKSERGFDSGPTLQMLAQRWTVVEMSRVVVSGVMI